MPNDRTPRDRDQRRVSALKTERQSFIDQYKSLAEFISPRRGRFQNEGTQRNRGGQEHWNKIVNSQATWALRVATAGMFTGLMSPTRPWLIPETDDRDILEFGPAKDWFFIAQTQMQRIFNASNLYNMAPMMFREELLFGTGCISHVDDLEDLCRFYTHTAGSYMIAQNDKFKVDTVGREFERSVAQIVEQFSVNGELSKNISPAVRDQYDRGNYDVWYPVVQLVEPNPDMRLGSLRPSQRRFRSVYYEPGNNDKDAYLSRKGFDEFPFYCPRWEVTNEDVYGTDCPGMTALGDVRQLQHHEKRGAQGLDKQISPPVHGPASLRNAHVSSLPGGGTFYDAPGANNVLKPIYEVNLPFRELDGAKERIEARIGRAFMTDLFMAISTMEGIQPKNQLELTQRNQERLLQLGPTLERQFGDFLDPMASRIYNQLTAAGLIPEPPPVLLERPLTFRYVGALAQAQRAVATGGIDRLTGYVGNLVAVGLSDGKKFDGDQAIDEYATLIGVPPRLVVPDDIVAQRREAEQRQIAAQRAIEAGQQIASIGESMGKTKMTEDTLAGQAESIVARQ